MPTREMVSGPGLSVTIDYTLDTDGRTQLVSALNATTSGPTTIVVTRSDTGEVIATRNVPAGLTAERFNLPNMNTNARRRLSFEVRG